MRWTFVHHNTRRCHPKECMYVRTYYHGTYRPYCIIGLLAHTCSRDDTHSNVALLLSLTFPPTDWAALGCVRVAGLANAAVYFFLEVLVPHCGRRRERARREVGWLVSWLVGWLVGRRGMLACKNTLPVISKRRRKCPAAPASST